MRKPESTKQPRRKRWEPPKMDVDEEGDPINGIPPCPPPPARTRYVVTLSDGTVIEHIANDWRAFGNDVPAICLYTTDWGWSDYYEKWQEQNTGVVAFIPATAHITLEAVDEEEE